MKILLFIPALNAGGAERVMVTIANYLVCEGNTVEILTLNTDNSFYMIDKRIQVKGMNLIITNTGLKRKFDILYMEFMRRREFIRETNKFNPDVVLSFLNTTNFIALSAKKQVSCPIIVSERNDPLCYSKFIQFLCKKIYKKADILVCQGKKVSDYYKKFGIDCRVVPNPLNSKAVGLYTGNWKNKIVTVGRLIEAKNQQMLIKAFAKISDKYPDYTVEIYGEGPLKEDLYNLIKKLNLENRVLLCGNKKNIMTLVSDYCCFVLSSNYEGFPNVLLEAMASGLPVISTNFSTGIANELIKNGVNGYVIDTNDINKLSSKLEKLIVDENLNLTMRKNNLIMNKIYSEDLICKRWSSLLKEQSDRGHNDRKA